MKKKIISGLLLMAMLLPMMSLGVISAAAAEADTPTITVDSITARQGDTATVSVRIANNPGILGATLTFTFDEGLTLTDAESGEAFDALQMTPPGALTSPCSFVWDATNIAEKDILDGVILTLTFDVAEYETVPETPLKVTVSCAANGIRNRNLKPVTATLVSGGVKVIDYVCGDLNDDDSVDVGDVILLRRYLAGGYGDTVNEKAMDIYADGTVDVTDVITLRRYLAGGYGIDSLPVVPEGEEPDPDPDPETGYTVRFLDYNNTVISTQKVQSGGSAVLPQNPTRNGYTFLDWDTDSGNVVCNMDITARYVKTNQPTFIVGHAAASPGASDVAITVALKNNPDISALGLKLAFDSDLTLTSVVYNSDVSGQFMPPATLSSPARLTWLSPLANVSGDWNFVTLHFAVSQTAAAGKHNISVTYDADDVYNMNDDNIGFDVLNGSIYVTK